MKITEGGIVNSLKILEQKLGKTNDFIVFKKIMNHKNEIFMVFKQLKIKNLFTENLKVMEIKLTLKKEIKQLKTLKEYCLVLRMLEIILRIFMVNIKYCPRSKKFHNQ